MNPNKCSTCKYWKREYRAADYKAINKERKKKGLTPIEPWPLNHGQCTQVHDCINNLNNDVPFMIFTEAYTRSYEEPITLMTNENFGCILHQPITQKP